MAAGGRNHDGLAVDELDGELPARGRLQGDELLGRDPWMGDGGHPRKTTQPIGIPMLDISHV